jgi:polyisoprenyl-phosphate glycosyltransferase
MPAADLHDGSSLSAVIAYSVVVPVYNSAPVLARLYARLIAVMASLGKRFELVFVDDDSADASWSLLAEIARTDPRVLAIRLAHNVGQGDATLAGLRASSGEILVTIDDDLQYMPEEIPNLLAALDGPEWYDAIFGVPATRRHPAWRKFASSITNILVSPVLGKSASLHFTAFRAMRRPVVERMLALSWPDPFLSALLFQVTRRIGAVRVTHAASALASSRYSLRKLARVPSGLFAALSERDRRGFGRFIGMIAVVLTALASVGFLFRHVGIMIGIFPASAGILAVLAPVRLAFVTTSSRGTGMKFPGSTIGPRDSYRRGTASCSTMRRQFRCMRARARPFSSASVTCTAKRACAIPDSFGTLV